MKTKVLLVLRKDILLNKTFINLLISTTVLEPMFVCIVLVYMVRKTKEAITSSGWYRTGDLGRMRPSGHLEIVGRIKDMISRGGEKIFPAEVEAFLYTHPNVSEVQVIGVPHPRLGEEVLYDLGFANK